MFEVIQNVGAVGVWSERVVARTSLAVSLIYRPSKQGRRVQAVNTTTVTRPRNHHKDLQRLTAVLLMHIAVVA